MHSTILLLSGYLAISYARDCLEMTVPIAITASNAVFNLVAPGNRFDVTDFILDLTRAGHNLTAEIQSGVSY
jgi:hypothetical protein